MRTSSLAKLACVISLLGLAVLPVSARSWDRSSYRDPAVTQPGRMEWAWDGGKKLAVGVPGTVHYSEGGAPRVVITGPDELLRHVRFGGGNIGMEDDEFPWSHSWNGERLDITVTGVALDQFIVSGSGKMLLGKLSRNNLSINVSGSGAVEADALVKGDAELKVSGSGHINFGTLQASNLTAKISGSGTIDGRGRADTLDLNMSGSGRFADIASNRASVTMSGSGRATIAARDEAHVRISGSATVRMPTKPAQLDVSVSGSGHVITANSD
ncbi:MAG: DUF2807 domain-containing protein [Alphaproteobacteria bacterium]|nr:DUF2807 domain-containing protein [Alphaproteobacteria bacterium]